MLKKHKIQKLTKVLGKLNMLDEIYSYKIREKIYAKKKLHGNEWFYKIHLKDRPLMPGILQSEAMLQSIICLLHLDEKNKFYDFLIFNSKNTFYAEIKGAKTLRIFSNILEIKDNYVRAKSVLKIQTKIMAKGEFTFIINKRKN